MKLPTVYVLVTDFDNLGLGSGGDATPDRGKAYDAYADCTTGGLPTRAFRLEFDVETNALETSTEITDEFHAEYEAIMEERS